MIIKGKNYFFISENSNSGTYWQNSIYPEWSSIVTFRYFPNQKCGSGVEPHYHDCDEIWLFAGGKGEVWLNDKIYKITPNTLVYTPMGTIHRFQMFTDFENIALVTRLERDKRPIHITQEEHGAPKKTVSGFVISGEENNGPVKDRGKRFPLTELRRISLIKNETIKKEELPCNEYWTVIEGEVSIKIDNFDFQLFQGDVTLLKKGLNREIKTRKGCNLALARE